MQSQSLEGRGYRYFVDRSDKQIGAVIEHHEPLAAALSKDICGLGFDIGNFGAMHVNSVNNPLNRRQECAISLFILYIDECKENI